MTDVKNIFRLRKEGELEEALAQARELFDTMPNDPWVIRAYAWVLYDKIKLAQAAHNDDEASQFSEELSKLNIPKGDDILIESVGRILRQNNPRERKLREASELDYAGNPLGALRIFREIKNQFSETDTAFHTAYGWSLYKYLKEIIPDDDQKKQIVESCLAEYFNELHVEKPSLLHSLMMMLLVQKLKDRHEALVGYGSFIRKEHFRTEDFDSQEKGQQTFQPLFERVAQTIGKALFNAGTPEQIAGFQPVMDEALALYANNLWLFYYKAKMLMKTGRPDEAEAFVAKVVRQKRNEFWAWALMGDIYSRSNPEKALACYCKSLLCKSDEKYLINTHLVFGMMLKEQGYYNEARTEIDKSVRTRQEHGYSIPGNIRQLTEEDWYRNAAGSDNNLTFYRSHEQLANSVLREGLPVCKANVISLYTRPDDTKGTLRARILVEKHPGVFADYGIRVNLYESLKNIKKGDAISVWLEDTGDKAVVDIDKRESDEPYDVLPTKIGVVDHINHEKKVTHILIDREEDVLLPGDTMYKIGDCVALKTVKGRQKDGKFNEVLHHQATSQPASLRIYQQFSGIFSYHSSGATGYVGSVFINRVLVEANRHALRDGLQITGEAVNRMNPKTGKWNWVAIRLHVKG